MNFLSFKEFVDTYRLGNEATSNIKRKELLDTLSAFGKPKLISTEVCMRDDQFTTTSGIVNLHHCVMFVNEFYFDFWGCPPPVDIT